MDHRPLSGRIDIQQSADGQHQDMPGSRSQPGLLSGGSNEAGDDRSRGDLTRDRTKDGPGTSTRDDWLVVTTMLGGKIVFDRGVVTPGNGRMLRRNDRSDL